METFSTLLALCAGNSPVTGEFPAQRPVTRSFDVSFNLHLNERLSKQSWDRWFAVPSRSLWCHCNVVAVWGYMVYGVQNGLWVSLWWLARWDIHCMAGSGSCQMPLNITWTCSPQAPYWHGTNTKWFNPSHICVVCGLFWFESLLLTQNNLQLSKLEQNMIFFKLSQMRTIRLLCLSAYHGLVQERRYSIANALELRLSSLTHRFDIILSGRQVKKVWCAKPWMITTILLLIWLCGVTCCMAWYMDCDSQWWLARWDINCMAGSGSCQMPLNITWTCSPQAACWHGSNTKWFNPSHIYVDVVCFDLRVYDAHKTIFNCQSWSERLMV